MERNISKNTDRRRRLMHEVGMNLPVLTSESDWATREFSRRTNLSANEFHALVFVAIAEMESVTLTAGGLRHQMGLSGPAITYLLQGLAAAGYLKRDTDPADRRKVIIRQTDQGRRVVRGFFRGVGGHVEDAMSTLSTEELEAAHRTFQVMIQSMKDFRADLSRLAPKSTG